MKRLVLAHIFLFFFLWQDALSQQHVHRIMHKHWLKFGKPSPDEQVKVTFAIKRNNPDWLEEKLKAVSYPNSPEYGNYMNFDEIAKYVHGRAESVEAVIDALASVGAGYPDFTIGKDFAVAQMPVQAAEDLFHADFYEFQHREQVNLRIVKSLAFNLPSSLKHHLDFVIGVTEFPSLGHPVEARITDTVEVGTTTPSYIAKSYNMSGYVCQSLDNSQAVASFMNQYINPTDIEKFQQDYSVTIRSVDKIIGENDPDNPGKEASLDVEYITALGQNVSTWFVSVSTVANNGQEDFLSWIIGQVNTTDSPWVHSVSYGDCEDSIENKYLARVEDEFKKFGISGRTLLFGSGDDGVTCTAELSRPTWPASSPYVTAVGGTVDCKEVWSNSGGGFSNVNPMPEYQKEAVEAYLSNASLTSLFNTSGRAYPDVSAFATSFPVIVNGVLHSVHGTSCAAPTFAGIISSLNDIRLLNGTKTLGFLNPLLYQTLKGEGFFDVTEGSSNGDKFCDGFKTDNGWDPASGWGSPNFGELCTFICTL